MPPLFSCAGCGVQIERSTRSYVQRKGRVLCSTCLDRLDDGTELQPRPGRVGSAVPSPPGSGGADLPQPQER